MKLWILRPIDENATQERRGHQVKMWSWDCAYGYVVRAEDEKGAREIIASASSEDWKTTPGDEGPEAWRDSNLTSCDELTTDGVSEIILRDFSAG